MQKIADRAAIVLISDKNYHEVTEFCIASLIVYHKSQLDIHFFQVDYEADFRVSLKRYAEERGHRLYTHFMEKLGFKDDLGVASASLHQHISIVTLMKAHAIESLSVKYDRIVYLDGDVLVCNDLDFNDVFGFKTSFAAVYDFVSYMRFDGQDLIAHAEKTGVSPDYFNAGVILINSDLWMSKGMLARYLDNLSRHTAHCPYRHDERGNDPGDCRGADQCAFNMTAESDWTPLDFRWNAQKPIRHTRPWRDAILRHYTGRKKFLTEEAKTRDGVEYRTIRKVAAVTGLQPSNKTKYLFGVHFLADKLRYISITGKYAAMLSILSGRMKARTPRHEASA
jgi:lipopolysaccharide biosynthesis glycosyltransferase